MNWPLTKKLISCILMLLVAGMVRHAVLERSVANELQERGILPEPLELEVSEALGQTSSAIALGGLRSLVAAMMNYTRIVPAWETQNWAKIFETFETIHALQPKVSYYWEAAASYAAVDAYSDYRDKIGLSADRRRLMQDAVFQRGLAYLDDGMRFLPEEAQLPAMKARLLSDTTKRRQIDYRLAAEVLDHAITLPTATDNLKRTRLYLICRIPERREEALQVAREIYDKGQAFPSVVSIIFSLQNEYQLPDQEALTAEELFGNEADQFRALFNYYQRRREGFPMSGVKDAIDRLLAEKNPPVELNPFINRDIKRYTLKLVELFEQCPLDLSGEMTSEGSDWPFIYEHFREYGASSLPTVRAALFVLQNRLELPEDQRLKTEEIFPGNRIAFSDLYNYSLNREKGYPMDGVEAELDVLAQEMRLPPRLDPRLDNSPWEFLDNSWLLAFDTRFTQED